jgi:hypothetical protein
MTVVLLFLLYYEKVELMLILSCTDAFAISVPPVVIRRSYLILCRPDAFRVCIIGVIY